MQSESTNLVGIIPKYEAALVAKELGYSARLNSISSAGQLLRFHEMYNTTYYDREITEDYIRNFE
ncbi:hypothetical protein FACS189499_07890 [Clostridia bacterium]|nr:hypothetical protein FACS189499_07890 [Clostridia bacterium]